MNRSRYIRHLLSILFLISISSFFPPLLNANENPCMKCHAKKDLHKINKNKKKVSLYVDEKEYSESVHESFECLDCHADAQRTPHKKNLEKVDCSGCHEEAFEKFSKSASGKRYLGGNRNAP